jgi:hypothetical protein
MLRPYFSAHSAVMFLMSSLIFLLLSSLLLLASLLLASLLKHADFSEHVLKNVSACSAYQLNRHDSAYNLQYFLGHVKGSWLFKMQKTSFSVLKPRLSLTAQIIYLYAPCRLFICDVRELNTLHTNKKFCFLRLSS